MSAVAGVYFFHGAPVGHGLIDELTNSMQRRGPDAQTNWTNGSISLGHCALRATPESQGEQQPLISMDSRCVLVWDGRLDNREELRKNLSRAGITVRGNTDSELVLSAYLTWDEACPKRLLGDFAFAIWDKSKKRLFCARDPVGARPLYFTHNKHLFAFASEDESLLLVPGVSNKPNADRVATVLVMPFYRCCDPMQTWLDDVRRVAPGHSVSIEEDGTIRDQQYYTFAVRDELKFRSDEECHEAFLEVFSEAVKCRLRSHAKPSLMMSGGLDSTAIAAMTRYLRPTKSDSNFPVFSVISDDADSCIETRCIRDVIDRLSLDGNFISVPSISGLSDIEDLVSVFADRPHPISHSVLMIDLVCLAAAKQGYRVMMHGVSGDLSMDIPDDYLAWYFKKGMWKDGIRECRAASQNNIFLNGHSPLGIVLRTGWRHFTPRRAKKLVNSARGKSAQARLSGSIISKSFARHIELVERLDNWQDAVREAYRAGIQDGHIALLYPVGLMSGLEGYERVAGNHSLEWRDPWADTRVLDFFTRLPIHYKVRDGWTKYLVRSTLEQSLGPQVVSRKDKQHVGWHVIKTLMEHQREAISKQLRGATDTLGPYVSRNALDRTLDRYETAGAFDDVLTCYRTHSLALWLEGLK